MDNDSLTHGDGNGEDNILAILIVIILIIMYFTVPTI
jgi:hypothetical protein